MEHPATILISETDPLLRMAAAEAVAALGYHVVGARDADETIAILSARPDIRLVFGNIDVLDAKTHAKLAEYLGSRRPPVTMIAVAKCMLAPAISRTLAGNVTWLSDYRV